MLQGNTGGLSGLEGIRYALGEGSPDIATRTLPVALGRLRKSILAPLTKIDADDKVKLKDFDRQLGAGFGMLKGVALCLIITMFAMTLLGASQQQRIANSRSGLYISKILANSGGILPAEIKQIVGPYIANVEQKLQQNQNGLSPQAGDGLLDGLGQMVQQGVNQLGNEVRNGQMPTNFMPGQGGGQSNQANGGFFGAGQGGQNPVPVNNQGWGNFNNAPQQPAGWPVSQQQQPQQPQPINNNWQNGFQTGFDNNAILPR